MDHPEQSPVTLTIRYVEESRVSVAPEVSFNEWYTPAELLDVRDDAPVRVAAPWFNNFGSSSALLAHMRPREPPRFGHAAPQYGSTAARHGRWSTDDASLDSEDTVRTTTSVLEGLLVKARRASESIASFKQSIKKKDFSVWRMPKISACFCAMPEPQTHRV